MVHKIENSPIKLMIIFSQLTHDPTWSRWCVTTSRTPALDVSHVFGFQNVQETKCGGVKWPPN